MSETPDILKRILARTAEDLAERKARVDLATLERRAAEAPPVRAFRQALADRLAAGQAAVIAEIKRASPSRGVLREDFDPAAIAASYERGGAACLSVLTDAPFFQGCPEYLTAARAACSLPVLRKDFLFDPYQIVEARAMGADCVLLIVAMLDDATIQTLAKLARDWGMDALVEVHDREELLRVRELPDIVLGINNRDLRTFHTDLDNTVRLLPDVPEGCPVVTESGILEPADVARMRRAGVHSFLVGEAFMRAPDPGARLRALFFDAPSRTGGGA